jgi:uncharacterized protein YutE (UPF0331/DUF86 family)
VNDLIRQYEDFVQELRAEYANRGYSSLSPQQFSSALGFQPDLVLKRGNETRIVEVKAGRRPPRLLVQEMRQRAEAQGYRFDLKILPRSPKRRTLPPDHSKVSQLLDEAKEFDAQKRYDLALILSWIAIEICVRVIRARENTVYDPVINSSDLVRLATELDVINEDYLQTFRAIAELRNRLVHGFETEVPPDLVREAMKLSRHFASHAHLLPPAS